MKSLLAPLIAVAVCAVFLAVLVWSPWDARERERELEWVEAFAAWFEDVEARLPLAGTACRASFDRDVGSAPTGRLQTAATAARAGCRHARNEHGWQSARWNVLSGLVDGHSSRARATFEPGLSRIAGSIAGQRARTHCWLEDDWAPLARQYESVRSDEVWPVGMADTVRGRIDLAPEVCEQLRLYEQRVFPAPLTLQNLELAEALVVLAHEAEHLRVPGAAEAIVECYALQRVRPLVREGGRGPAYQDELAGLAVEISYPNLPEEYQTDLCRDGGPLDLNPDSSVWP